MTSINIVGGKGINGLTVQQLDSDKGDLKKQFLSKVKEKVNQSKPTSYDPKPLVHREGTKATQAPRYDFNHFMSLDNKEAAMDAAYNSLTAKEAYSVLHSKGSQFKAFEKSTRQLLQTSDLKQSQSKLPEVGRENEAARIFVDDMLFIIDETIQYKRPPGYKTTEAYNDRLLQIEKNLAAW